MAVALIAGGLASQMAKTLTGKVVAFGTGVLLTVAVLVGVMWLLRMSSSRIAPSINDQDLDPWRDAATEPNPTWQQIWDRISKGPSTRTLDTSTWSMDLLRGLEWHRLEIVCVAYFQALGFKAELTSFGADGGIDIRLYADGSAKCAIVVQCKAWNTREVGVRPVRELLGVMTDEKVREGVFVTTGTFTPDAREFGKRNKLHLIDGGDLLDKLLRLPADRSASVLKVATEGDYTTPTCPSCGVKMVSRRNKNEGSNFWGCRNYPRCRQTLFSA